MGLDMYLTEKKNMYLSNRRPEHTNLAESLREAFGTGAGDLIVTVSEERMYWRKANAIHNWFVENVQDGEDDCKEYHVTYQDLAKLKETCDEVLESRFKNPEIANCTYKLPSASELLPTKSGFFFGSTDYDENYVADLEYTSYQIDQILAKVSWDTLKDSEKGIISNYYYQSCW